MSITATWLDHAMFSIQTPDGKHLLIDPWIAGNPACPDDKESFENINIIIITHDHFDHIAYTVLLTHKHKPTVVGIFELCKWLERKGVESRTSPP